MWQHRRWAMALVLAFGLSLGLEALADEVDWSEYMEPRSAPAPRRADEDARAQAPREVRRAKRAKVRRGKQKQARGKAKRRAARNSRRR